VAAQDDPERTAPLELSHRICPTGEAVVDLGGELDISSAEAAVSYVKDVIDRHRGPVVVDLTTLNFCDARGLAALVRMAGYAEQMARPFRLASPGPSLIKIMRITGLNRRFFASRQHEFVGSHAQFIANVPQRPDGHPRPCAAAPAGHGHRTEPHRS
jgi:anti-anti-sigma factor